MTRAEKRKKRNQTLFLAVAAYLGISDEELNILVFNAGVSIAERYHIAGKLKIEAFWDWWANVCAHEFENFLEKIELCLQTGDIWYHDRYVINGRLFRVSLLFANNQSDITNIINDQLYNTNLTPQHLL